VFSLTVSIVDNSLHFVKNFSRFVLKGLATHVYNSLSWQPFGWRINSAPQNVRIGYEIPSPCGCLSCYGRDDCACVLQVSLMDRP